MVFFETPHRIRAALADLSDVFGEAREAVIARELTKLHEEVLHGRLVALRETLTERPTLKGEFTLVIAPPDP